MVHGVLDEAIKLALDFFPLKISRRKRKLRCIVALVEGRDVLAWLPTGFGKSLIYQFYSKIFELVKCKTGCHVLVVSALKAITVEQVQEMNEISRALKPPC